MFYVYAIILLVMSLAGFISMWIDKNAARKHRRRIPERVLFGIAVFGGSFGCYLGMRVFHHKTRHKRFSVGLPVLMLLHLILLVLLASVEFNMVENPPPIPGTEDSPFNSVLPLGSAAASSFCRRG